MPETQRMSPLLLLALMLLLLLSHFLPLQLLQVSLESIVAEESPIGGPQGEVTGRVQMLELQLVFSSQDF